MNLRFRETLWAKHADVSLQKVFHKVETQYFKNIILVFFLVATSKQARPPVPIFEFSHYVKEMKEKNNNEFKKEYEVRTKIDLHNVIMKCWVVWCAKSSCGCMREVGRARKMCKSFSRR